MAFTIVPLHNLDVPAGSRIPFGSKFILQDVPEWLKKERFLENLANPFRPLADFSPRTPTDLVDVMVCLILVQQRRELPKIRWIGAQHLVQMKLLSDALNESMDLLPYGWERRRCLRFRRDGFS